MQLAAAVVVVVDGIVLALACELISSAANFNFNGDDDDYESNRLDAC